MASGFLYSSIDVTWDFCPSFASQLNYTSLSALNKTECFQTEGSIPICHSSMKSSLISAGNVSSTLVLQKHVAPVFPPIF